MIPMVAQRRASKYAEAFGARTRGAGCAADACAEAISEEYLALQNVVANVGLGTAVDNKAFTDRRPYAYVPARFEAAAVVRYVHTDQTTILLFNTGCVVVVGSKSPEQTIQAIHRLRFAMESDGVSTGVTEFELVNMVYVAKIEGIDAIDIAGINRSHMKNSSWAPETFPGLRLTRDGLLMRIFDTNRIVFMGAKRPKEIRKQREYMMKLCEKFQCAAIPPSNKRYRFRIDRQHEVLDSMPIPANLLSDKTGSVDDVDDEDDDDVTGD